MAARAQEISQEAGSKIAGAMKEVIGAAAGISTFAIESARDVIQFMVRRGALAPAEADKLMREVEDAHGKRKPTAKPAAGAAADTKKPAPHPAAAPVAHAHAHAPAPKPKTAKAAKPAHAAKPASHPAAKSKSSARKPAPKPAKASRPAAKKKKK